MKIIALRIFSAIWLGLSAFFVYKIILFLRKNYFNAIFGALGILALPAFYFYAKPISAEFITMAFALASIYFIVRDRQQFGWRFQVSIFLLAIAIGLKTSIAVSLPIYGLYFLLTAWKKGFKKILSIIGIAAIVGIFGFFLSNPYIFTLKGGYDHYIGMVKFNMEDNKTGHGKDPEAVTVSAWYEKGVKVDYMPSAIIIIASIGFLMQMMNKESKNRTILAFIYLLFLFNLSYILLSVNKIWTYYLFLPFFLSLIGLFTLNFKDFNFLKKYWKFEKPFLLIFILVLFFMNVSVIKKKYLEMMNREKTPAFQEKISAKEQFDTWLVENNYSNIKVLKYPYIYFDDSLYDNIVVNPYWGPLADWHFPAYQPDMLLIANSVHDEMLKSPQNIYKKIVSEGIKIQGKFFRYKVVLETDDFKVLKRVKKSKKIN